MPNKTISDGFFRCFRCAYFLRKMSSIKCLLSVVIYLLFILICKSNSSTDDVELHITGTTWDTYGNFLNVFTLKNSSAHPVFYDGYSLNEPIRLRQIQNEKQEWQDLHYGYCGVGLGRQHLQPGESITFTESAPKENQTWKVGVTFTFRKQDNLEVQHTVWSQPIDGVNQKRTQPDASEMVKLESRKDSKHKFPYTFTLTNISKQVLYYGGFHELDVPPIYINQEKHKDSWQNDGKAVWNGEGASGFGFQELSPGKSIIFSIPAQSHVIWRIGIILFRTSTPKSYEDAYQPVWCSPQSPGS